jgi:hypothetical protein
MKHVSYPSIEQFRNAVHHVTSTARYAGRDANDEPIYNTNPLPTLKFEGTVKLHGTNAAIGLLRDYSINGDGQSGHWFQSREKIIDILNDNAGFVRFMSNPELDLINAGRREIWEPLFDSQWSDGSPKMPQGVETIIYGEWCGGNIQKGVAIAELPKMFVIFDIRIDGVWQSKEVVKRIHNKSSGIFNIYDFATAEIDIDFEFPQKSQNQLSDLTIKVEELCPVAWSFGVSGVGEGIVWRCITPGWEDPKFRFKVKGEKHSASKVKTLAAVDVEKVASMKEFAANVVTENRCRQGIDILRQRGLPTDKRSLGEFIKWIVGDVEKEESDTAAASGIEFSKVKGEISNIARTWFFKNELSF